MMMKELYKRLGFATLVLWFCSSVAFAQDRTVSGKIIDENGLALPGVSVLVKGTQSGTVTDADGAYTIGGVNDNSILVFSFIGYKAEEVAVSSRTVIDMAMTTDVNTLQEVVVIGYGEQKKALVTGANIHQDGAQLQALNTSSVMEALQGITPGVSISRNNGQPGAGTKVRIRGIGTIENSNPLYIVDGVPVGNDINYLAPSDIQSIDVLKDAASAAIYGSRGANGVVLVTTRRGKKGDKPQLSYNAYYGFQNIYKKPPSLNAQEYMFIMDEGLANDGKALTDWEGQIKDNSWLDENSTDNLGAQYGEHVWNKLQSGWKGTDWVDEITQKNAPVISHALNITGATDDLTYAAGFSYLDQTGIIGGDIINAGFKKITGRLNTEIKLLKISDRKILKLGENITYTNTQNRSTGTGNIYWNDLHDALVTNPLMPAYWEGSPDKNGFSPTLEDVNLGQSNPIASMYYRHNFNWGKGNNLIGNIYGELEPIEKLKLRSSYGINSWFGHSRGFSPAYGLSRQFNRPSSARSITQSAYQGVNTTWTNTASYEATFSNHNVTVLVGTEQVKNDVLNFNVGGSRLWPLYDDPAYAYLDNASAPTLQSDLNTWGKDWAANGGKNIMSYMGRLSYNYHERYMLDFTARRDGSSNFIANKRWGNFYAVSAGWNFMEEDFLSSLSNVFDVGKLRASWGQNGNQDVGAFLYQTNIIPLSQGYYFGDKLTSTTTYIPKNTPNPDLGWETSEQLDFGLDATLLHSKLSVTVDWYQKLTKDWLVLAPVLGTTGAEPPWINGGDVKNTGFEFILGWKDKVGEFQYGVTVSGATVKNEVTRIANAEKRIYGSDHVLSQGTSYVSRVQVGYPIGYFYGFQTAGILQNQAEVDAYVGPEGLPMQFPDESGLLPGDVRFVDQNNDGKIDEDDKVMLGNPIPDFELGVQLNASWKGIYANVTLAGKYGHQVMRSYRSFADNFEQNYTTEIFGRWHGEGTSNRIPRLSSISHRNQQYISDIYMYDADYLRINNLTIGYDLKSLAKQVAWFQAAQVYMTVNNLYTFTKYEGMDPEVTYGGSGDWASGVDLGLYPLPRTVMFGVNLTF
jgi:TonB-dependent starch-binding outer membrane protein SusC